MPSGLFGVLASLPLFVALTTTPSVAQQSQVHPTVSTEVSIKFSSRLAAFSSGALHLTRSHSDRSPHLLIASSSTATPLFSSSANSAAIAQALDRYASNFMQQVLGYSSEVASVQRSTTQVDKLWQSTFGITINGIPLAERSMKLVASVATGKLMMIDNNLPIQLPTNSAPAISIDAAKSAATEYFSTTGESVRASTEPALIYVMVSGNPAPVLVYLIVESNQFHSYSVWIDAITGAVLKSRDVNEYGYYNHQPSNGKSVVSGKITVRIHPQSPYDSLITVPLPYTFVIANGGYLLTDTLGYWADSDATYPTSVFTNFSTIGHHTSDTAGGLKNSAMFFYMAPGQDTDLEWNDGNSNAAERDAYYHVGSAERYVMRLDSTLDSGLTTQLTVNVNVDAICNAFYSPENISLNFFKSGGGCSNTGEIRDIIYHEFGHRVADIRYHKTTGANIVDGSLSEGFADLLSAFMRDDPRIGIDFYGKGTVLRTCDNTKKWPQDLNPDIHITGEIVSGAFWDLRKAIGHDKAEQLFHKMEYLHPDGTDQMDPISMQDAFISVLLATLAADDTDGDLSNGTPHAAQIFKAFAGHSIDFSPFLTILSNPIPDQDTVADGYQIAASAFYSGQVGNLDTSNVLVYYTTNHWTTSSKLIMQSVGADSFTTTIPKQVAGSLVEYYIQASSTYVDGGSGYAPATAPGLGYGFLVGYKPWYTDDAEEDREWSLSQPSDQATAGRWVRDTPFGTYSVPGVFVQQDTDHSPFGTMCYLTGNANAATHNRDVSIDDVDNGSTTLTTPVLDLTKLNQPAIRFWYYFTNNAGSVPGIDTWKTLVSSDSGKTWKYLLDTRVSTQGWTSFLFKVSNYVLPTKTVQLRFVATDSVGAVVEAGVDDLQILQAQGEAASISSGSAVAGSLSLTELHPNPVGVENQIAFLLATPVDGHIVVQVKDVLGRIVSTVLDRNFSAGEYPLQANTASLPAGVYWLELQSAAGARVARFTINR
jgi:Zn-dependent metalloprotease